MTGFLAKILILFEVIAKKRIYIAVLLIIISSVSVFYYIRIIKIMFFEPKSIEKSYEKFQVVFYNNFLDNIYLCIAFLLFVLIIVFFFPSALLIFCQYIVLNIGAF